MDVANKGQSRQVGRQNISMPESSSDSKGGGGGGGVRLTQSEEEEEDECKGAKERKSNLASKVTRLLRRPKQGGSEKSDESTRTGARRKRLWRYSKGERKDERKGVQKRKRPSFLAVISLDEEEDKPDSVINNDRGSLEELPEENVESAKSRLLRIVASDREGETGDKLLPPSSELKEIEGDKSNQVSSEGKGDKNVDVPPLQLDTEEEKDEGEQQQQSFFQRGSSFVRSSLRKMQSFRRKGARSEVTLNDVENIKGKLARSEEGCNSSEDSGLGEDSDFEGGLRSSSLLSTSPRTPTPGVTPTSIIRPSTTTLSSSLRKASSASSSNGSALGSKKHVIIREPSLSTLPSVAKRLRKRRLETVRMYSRPSRVPSLTATGDVSPQWGRLFAMAYAEVMSRVGEQCDAFTVRLIFDPDHAGVKQDVQDLEAVDDIAVLIHSVYKVLYHDWLGRSSTHLSIIVHCVQRFLVIVVDVVDIEMDERLRFARTFRDLLRSSEMTGYGDVGECLQRTRKCYVDLWVSLLCSPFSRTTSPTVSMIHNKMEAAKDFIKEEDEEEEYA